jgi:hypothetical protein
MQFKCDIRRCNRWATWHGFDGRSHFCNEHKPEAASERPEAARVRGLGAFKSDGDLLGVNIETKERKR